MLILILSQIILNIIDIWNTKYMLLPQTKY